MNRTAIHQSELPFNGAGAAELGRRIARRELSASEVLEATIRRIELVDGEVNGLVVRCFDEAREAAVAADRRLASGQPCGPLHGVPVTVKDCFDVDGLPTTLGLTSLHKHRVKMDAAVVRRLRAAGAILLGKTNVPQFMLMYECDNPLYGRTNNPWDYERTPGGSSGGEAAVVASGSSPLGIGTDMAGSIRVPSHFCGVQGLKPTSGLWDMEGIYDVFPAQTTIPFVPGPIARRVEDLALAFDVLGSGKPRPKEDPSPPATSEDLTGLRIVVWDDDPYFSVSPAIRRATRQARRIASDAGAIIVDLPPPDPRLVLSLAMGIMGSDGGAYVSRVLEGSEIDGRVRRLRRLAGIPRWVRHLLHPVLAGLGQRFMADNLASTGPQTATELLRLMTAVDEVRQQTDSAWSEAGIDAAILPPFALPALRHGDAIDLMNAAGCAILANLLDWPAGVVAATRVRADELSDRNRSARDRTVRLAAATECGSEGLPIGVQVLARPWREDLALRIMSALEAAFSGMS